MCSRSNWNLEVLVFKERRKPEYPEKNLSGHLENQQTYSTRIIILWHQRQDLNPGTLEASAFITATPLLPHVLHKGASSPFFTVAIHTKHIQY